MIDKETLKKKPAWILAGALTLLLISPADCGAQAFDPRQSAAEESQIRLIQSEIDGLEPVIGGWPPLINSEAEKEDVVKKYRKAKEAIDSALKSSPDNLELIFLRGKLRAMGHNINVKHAFEGAEADLLRVTQAEPKNTEALVILGFLYVNTNLKYAPTAEQYFLAAQRAEGRRFFLPAHRGLLFAYYYQERFKQCLKQAELILSVDPNDETAKEIRDLCLQKK